MSLETERGLPLALGNSLGPVAERGSSNGGGGGGGGGREVERRAGKEGWNLRGCSTQELFLSGLFWGVLPHCVHTRGELYPPSALISQPLTSNPLLLNPPPTSGLSFPEAFVQCFLFTSTFPLSFFQPPPLLPRVFNAPLLCLLLT